MTRLVQLQGKSERRIAIVREPNLELLSFSSIYDLIKIALTSNTPLAQVMQAFVTHQTLNYDEVYNGQSDWKLLPALDHPDPAHCVVSGTGLTHLGSAKNRNAMHGNNAQIENQKSKIENHETDSMKMFRWGLESGKPAPGTIGIAPEWFYKGSGSILRAHNDPLDVPPYAEDGGEEAEIVGLYVIDKNGAPVRVGMAQGNEFSDHLFEKKNYLNLAGSKLRTCSIGPELVLNPNFSSVAGKVRIQRNGTDLWSKELLSGENEMSHSLENIEHHHFKFEDHRIPGDVHIHYFGTGALSFGEAIHLQNNDIMEVTFTGFGRPLRNTLRVTGGENKITTVRAIQ